MRERTAVVCGSSGSDCGCPPQLMTSSCTLRLYCTFSQMFAINHSSGSVATTTTTTTTVAVENDATARNESTVKLFCRGVAMHITNPKAISVWLSVITLAFSRNRAKADALPIVVSCTIIGAIIFYGYAVLFSTTSAQQFFSVSRRWFDGILTVVFGAAGIRLLFSEIGN